MSNTRITQCQALLLDQPRVRFHKTLAINPASLLPDDDSEEPIHDCIEPEEIEAQNKNCQRSRPKTSGAFTSFSNPAVPGPTQTPSYTKQEEELAEQKQAIKDQMVDDRLLVPEALGWTLVAQLHQATHIGVDKVIRSIVTRSSVCTQVNTKQGKRVPLEFGPQGNSPGKHWEVDFTEIKPPASEYKYLLVLIDTFSGWVKAYPTRTETTSIVVKRLLQEIIPRFRLPVAIGSDNSPSFVAKVLQYTQRATHKLVRDALPVPTMDPVHPFQPRDSVWGRYTVILSTPTAVEVDGIQTWLHHSQLLHQETAWILATSGLTREIPSLGSTQARRRLHACRRGTGLHFSFRGVFILSFLGFCSLNWSLHLDLLLLDVAGVKGDFVHQAVDELFELSLGESRPSAPLQPHQPALCILEVQHLFLIAQVADLMLIQYQEARRLRVLLMQHQHSLASRTLFCCSSSCTRFMKPEKQSLRSCCSAFS
ncbi:hypothetical protein QTO34_016969, partial [Cnephaeus nilssonii]